MVVHRVHIRFMANEGSQLAALLEVQASEQPTLQRCAAQPVDVAATMKYTWPRRGGAGMIYCTTGGGAVVPTKGQSGRGGRPLADMERKI